ncbi:MAG: ABC transporter substrate-binding protein [Richelia sp. RM2_1_2]|nr:ABC transporter substrate-binding protein [Richelia sp. RM2_1_2]
MLGELLEVVTKLFEVSDRLKQAEDENRENIEQFFRTIEQCFRDSAEQLKKAQTPYGVWAELQVYADKLPEIVGDIYDQEKINELSRLLKIAANNTPTYTNIKDIDIKDIEIAAGIFKGLAVIVATQTELNSQKNKKQKNSKSILSLPISRRNFLSLAALTSSGAMGIGLANEYIQMPIVTWKMANFLDGNSNQLILSKAPAMIRDRIEKITNGRFKLEPYNNKILTEEILQRVSSGDKVQCGFSGIYYNNDKYKVLFFGSNIPHGLTPQEQTAWLLYKKDSQSKLTYIQELYQKPELDLNVIPFAAAATGAQMGGWFKKEINTINDFEGITMRIPGLGGEVLQKFNVQLDKNLPRGAIPPNKIVEAFKGDIIQAAEWIGPYDDFKLGLHKVGARYYYYPGWWEPSTTFDMVVNKDAWEKLPSHYQEIFKAVCLETYTEILAEYNQKNSETLEELREGKFGDITLSKFSPQIFQATQTKTQDLLKYYASRDDLFKEVYEEWDSFKIRIRKWSKLSSEKFE